MHSIYIHCISFPLLCFVMYPKGTKFNIKRLLLHSLPLFTFIFSDSPFFSAEVKQYNNRYTFTHHINIGSPARLFPEHHKRIFDLSLSQDLIYLLVPSCSDYRSP